MSMSATPCCDMGSDKGHPYRGTPAHTVVDDLGFVYGLCDHHYEARVQGLLRARTAEPRPGAGYAHRRYSSSRERVQPRTERPCRG